MSAKYEKDYTVMSLDTLLWLIRTGTNTEADEARREILRRFAWLEILLEDLC